MEISLTTWLKWKLGEFLTNLDKRNEAKYDRILKRSFDKNLSEQKQLQLGDKAGRVRLRNGHNSSMFIEASGYALGMTQDMTGFEKDAWYKYYYGIKLYSIIIKDFLEQDFP